MALMENELLPGYYNLEDLEFIDEALSKCAIDYDLLEIGCYLGRSTSVLGKYAKAANKILYCVDPFYGCEEPPRKEVVAFNFMNNMKTLGLLDYIRIFPIDSLSAAELHYFNEISLSVVHIDGSHFYDTVSHDIRWFGNYAKEILILHDTDRPEVQQAVKKDVGEEFKIYCQTKAMTIFQRGF